MGADSKIQWTDATWNPVVGCTKVSAGCKSCYAKTLHDKRHKAHGEGKAVPMQYAHPFEIVQTMPDRLRDPLSWKKPRRVFVNSVSDLFHEDIPVEFIDRVFAVMARCQRHTFQVLTKRPERMREYMREGRQGRVNDAATLHDNKNPIWFRLDDTPDGVAGPDWPLPNVWLGTSVENQATADERIPHLLATPARVRFLSCEPLLSDIHHLGDYLRGWLNDGCATCATCGFPACCRGRCENAGIHWVIAGCESGGHRRPMAVDWVESLRDQCATAGVAFFLKQMEVGGRVSGELDEFPAGLRIRQFPEV